MSPLPPSGIASACHYIHPLKFSLSQMFPGSIDWELQEAGYKRLLV